MNKPGDRILVVIAILSIIMAGPATPVSATSWQSKVDPWVLQTASDGDTEFLVYLTTQADLSAARLLPTKLEKDWFVYQILTSTAESTQKPVIADLEKLRVEYHTHWIANMIWVRGGLKIIQELAERPDVAHLYANP